MARSDTKKTTSQRVAGIGALVLATTALIAPSLATAQEQGQRGGRWEGRGGEANPNRGERMGGAQQGQDQRQWQPRERPQVQAPTTVQQQAPSAPAARQQGWDGNRDGGRRDDRQQAGRGNGNGPDTRNWTPQQWEAYRGAVLEGRDTDAFRNGANRPGQQPDRRNPGQWQGGRGDDRRDDGRGNDRRDDRASWQNDRQGNYGREFWRNNGQWRGGNVSRGDNRSWDRGWRSNNRYDWSSYRSRNRSVFQAGRYYSPYQNYSYRRVGIGLSLGSMFYGSRYWIDDPYAYRLPEVYGSYRWVRYYDDVLLVDTYTGEVVDAIYDFFY